MQKFYQSFDLGIVKNLIWQTSSIAYSRSQLSTTEIKAFSNTVPHVSLDGSKHLTLLLNGDQMRNYRLRLNFSIIFTKTQAKVILKHQNLTTSSPWDKGRTLVFLPVCPCLHLGLGLVSKTCRK